MIVKFTLEGPIIETTQLDRERLRKGETLLRNIALVPGHEKQGEAADSIKAFLATQPSDQSE